MENTKIGVKTKTKTRMFITLTPVRAYGARRVGVAARAGPGVHAAVVLRHGRVHGAPDHDGPRGGVGPVAIRRLGATPTRGARRSLREGHERLRRAKRGVEPPGRGANVHPKG